MLSELLDAGRIFASDMRNTTVRKNGRGTLVYQLTEPSQRSNNQNHHHNHTGIEVFRPAQVLQEFGEDAVDAGKELLQQGRVTVRKLAGKKNQTLIDQLCAQPDAVPVAPADSREISDAQKRVNAESRADPVLVTATGALGLAIAGATLYTPLGWLSIPANIYIGLPIFQEAWVSLVKQRTVNVALLSTIVIFSCLATQNFVAASLAGFTFAISRKLLSKIKRDSQRSLVEVFGQQPRSVWIMVDGVELEKPFEDVAVGDIVVVVAGETIAVDGTIVAGMASVDQHVLTGEAQPAEKGVGDAVLASTVVLSGRILVQVEHAGQETVAAQIIAILNRTVNFKTNLQLRAETLADRTVLPMLIISALAVPLLGLMGGLAVLNSHFRYKMSVLAPISVLNYMRILSEHGILVKDGHAFDRLNEVDMLVFDKTGTLTIQQPSVGQVYTCAGYTANEVLALAAMAEVKQTHPIALAILQEAQSRQLALPPIDDAAYVVGYGLKVSVSGHIVCVGSTRFMEKETIAIPSALQQMIEHGHAQGYSLVLVAIDTQVIGALELRPTVRPEARAVIQALRQRGITSTCIISGDHEAPTRALAQELGIDHYFAQTLPQHKADIIAQLQAAGRQVCFIGDGINDAIALKQAHVSISLRGASSVAIDTAQIILMDERLSQLCYLFDCAHEFDLNTRISFAAILASTAAGVAGAFCLEFGLIHTIVLNQLGLVLGLINTLLPRHEPPQLELQLI